MQHRDWFASDSGKYRAVRGVGQWAELTCTCTVPGIGKGVLMGGAMGGVDMEVWVFCIRLAELVLVEKDGESPDLAVCVCVCVYNMYKYVRVCVCVVHTYLQIRRGMYVPRF